METKSRLFRFNLSTLLLIIFGFSVAGSWWLDHKQLEEKIRIARENRRIILFDAQSPMFSSSYSPIVPEEELNKEDGHISLLSTAESQLRSELNPGEQSFVDLVLFICIWERLYSGTLDDDEYAFKHKYENSQSMEATQTRRFELQNTEFKNVKSQVLVDVDSDAVSSFDQISERLGQNGSVKLLK